MSKGPDRHKDRPVSASSIRIQRNVLLRHSTPQGMRSLIDNRDSASKCAVATDPEVKGDPDA
jgi:hypothetical protein